MLEIKKVLMGAKTKTPALNDFAKLVATKLPADGVDCQDLANCILHTALSVKSDYRDYGAKYSHLCEFVQQGGDMCILSARMVDVVDAGAPAKFAEDYRTTSRKFFGE